MNHSTFVKVDRETFFRFVANAPENERYEWVGGRIVQQQAGGTLKHVSIGRQFSLVLERALDPTKWIVNSGSDRGVDTPRTVRYPDVVVEPAGGDPSSLAATVPSLIVEVLSPTSSDRDLNEKPDEYLLLETLQAYIIASQDEAVCLVWVRGAGGKFAVEPMVVAGMTAAIAIPFLELDFTLADIYRGII
ncbi:MAG: Uma2 family endonuclease [Hyphomicrobiaceae bacterium]